MVSLENAIKRAKKETRATAKLTNGELYRVGDRTRRDLAKKILKERGYIIGTFAEVKRQYGSAIFGVKLAPSLFQLKDIYIFSLKSQVPLRKNTKKKEITLMPEYHFTSGRKINSK